MGFYTVHKTHAVLLACDVTAPHLHIPVYSDTAIDNVYEVEVNWNMGFYSSLVKPGRRLSSAKALW